MQPADFRRAAQIILVALLVVVFVGLLTACGGRAPWAWSGVNAQKVT